jgi:polyisoprenoid-binding protein YceI
MLKIAISAVAILLCTLSVDAQQRKIDTQKSTMVIHVGKTGLFSGLAHEHEIRARIESGSADTGPHPSVEIHVDARELRVVDQGESEKDRVEVQKTMLGPEVLDSEHYSEIVFKSTDAHADGEGRWILRGDLTLRGKTRPITVRVTRKGDHYTGGATVKQTDFGIKPPGKAGVRAKDEVEIEFDVIPAA